MWHMLIHGLGYFMLASIIFTIFLIVMGVLSARREK